MCFDVESARNKAGGLQDTLPRDGASRMLTKHTLPLGRASGGATAASAPGTAQVECAYGYSRERVSHGLWAMQLEFALSQLPNMELGGHLFQHVVRVVVDELFRGIRADVLQQDLAPTGVFIDKIGHIVDVALDANPCRLIWMVSTLPSRQIRYVPELCSFNSASVITFDMANGKAARRAGYR